MEKGYCRIYRLVWQNFDLQALINYFKNVNVLMQNPENQEFYIIENGILQKTTLIFIQQQIDQRKNIRVEFWLTPELNFTCLFRWVTKELLVEQYSFEGLEHKDKEILADFLRKRYVFVKQTADKMGIADGLGIIMDIDGQMEGKNWDQIYLKLLDSIKTKQSAEEQNPKGRIPTFRERKLGFSIKKLFGSFFRFVKSLIK